MKSHLLTILSLLLMANVIQAQVSSVAIIGSGTSLGWDAETPLVLLDADEQIYYGKMQLTANEVKFRADNDWAINWGATGFPIGTGVQGGPNIPIAVEGEYEILFNAITGEYFFYYESRIGIIGDATPTGWDEDINLFPDAADTNKYFVTLPLIQGKAKFRQDDDWAVNWGSADYPAGIGTQNGTDIPVPSAGNYSITFDKSTGAYNFEELVDFTFIGIIGTATPGGWDKETLLKKDPNNADLWTGSITLTEGEFKFRADTAWSVSWGGDAFPIGTASSSGGNIMVSSDKAGEYLVSFNTKTLDYKFQAIGNYNSIGIIGDATPGGWDTETAMVQSTTDKSVYTLRTKLVDGEAKFRANNAWDISWGGETFPAGVATSDNGPNIPVVAGDYKVTFNSTTGEYNFEAVVEYDKISLVGRSGPFGDWPGADDSRDAYLTKDANDINHWTLSNVNLTNFSDASDGGIKFRAEAKWDKNWGAKEFPSGTGTPNGPNIECVAGTYNVDFRSDTGDYAFTSASSTYDFLSDDVIKIFPNPAKEYINIEVNTDALHGDVLVTVYNNIGQQIVSQKLNVNGLAKVNTGGLNSGNYIVKISNAKNLVTKSIVIVK